MSDAREWLEADGLGGFASGTASGVRTRRYHALLLPATSPPTGRVVLINGFDAWLETPAGTYALSSQAYPDGVTYPNGAKRIERFTADPWPTWTFRCEDGTVLEQEIFAARDGGAVCLTFRVSGTPARAALTLRPFLSGRDYHSLHHENPGFRFDAQVEAERLTFSPYAGIPAFVVQSNGAWHPQSDWYRQFTYAEEQARGLDFTEDLATPGVLTFELSREPAALLLATRGAADRHAPTQTAQTVERLRTSERERRQRFPTRLHRAADAYVVKRRGGKTIVAGYPWFTDWGRDTFISLRGLCLAGGRLEDARAILLEWSGAVSEGMLPNRFADGDAPEFNSVDASLWFVVAVADYLRLVPGADAETTRRLLQAVDAILSGYAGGTRHRIRADSDGLLAAGEPNVQLTWMDAKIGDYCVTPRIGKPVEIQALWLNALAAAAARPGPNARRWRELLETGRASFGQRFWNAERSCLYDVVDCDHRSGAVDASVRPNQIFAVGGLPLPLLEGERARAVVDAVESLLWTPLGLRTLESRDPRYARVYRGSVRERDEAYHQGTVWPWLAGPFVEAWVRVRGGGEALRTEARERFLPGLLRHLDEAGIGHVSEIADGDAPHTPRGCPFQAWSVGELLRLSAWLGAPL